MAALETSTLRLGLNVTNPGTREPTVTASAFATLQAISGGRMVIGIGRGDSARRTIGQKPVKVDEFERATAMIKELANGKPVRWNDVDVQLEWAQGQPEIPVYVAGYGPRVLAVAGRVADGIIIQLADPEIIEWIVGQVRAAAEEAGRDPPRSRSWPAHPRTSPTTWWTRANAGSGAAGTAASGWRTPCPRRCAAGTPSAAARFLRAPPTRSGTGRSSDACGRARRGGSAAAETCRRSGRCTGSSCRRETGCCSAARAP